MPRGKYTNHKGKGRRFTNPEELEEQRKREEKERQWRAERGEETSSEEEDEGDKKKDKSGSSSSSESDSESSEDDAKAKGVQSLIQIENPNRVQKKVKKLSTLNETVHQGGKPELSRREREELEKQRATLHYQKLHAEGKTEEARADLARLAIIKQQRAEAAKRREEEKKAKDEAKQNKTAQTQKALGKRT
uniref:Casein kinase substrate phosphoprotein PP28 domain-containing protein n=1 Tax=Clastoptera arizonana TaxID=38151 RepID=A0A1B6D866_9HEMI